MTQDAQAVAELCRALGQAKGGKSRGGGKGKGFSCKKTTYSVAGSNGISVDSWRFQDWDYKRDDLPTYARGLFTSKRADGTPEIVSRGYDKFFNVDEVPSTKWDDIRAKTVGPYELSVKENGCIIFMSGLEDGTLLVCSKHSTGVRQDVDRSHAQVGEEWVKKHVESIGKTTEDLAQALRANNLTAVAELCDDDFEEHVLEYPSDMAGLYLHGLNYNLPDFATMSGPDVHRFADEWGFKKAQFIMIDTVDEVKKFLDECAETGSWNGRDTEGFVVRCQLAGRKDHGGPDWFFKYKFEEPYLMYRQWREATKSIIAGKPPKYKKHKKITEEYLLFARQQLAKDPKVGKLYNQNHGIIKMRDDFLAAKGQKGSDIIRQEQGQDEEWTEYVNNIVLVPIATIGCGKTTVANGLVSLFDFGHVQNDNIEGQRGRPQRFAMLVTNAMAAHRVVIADRNNHQLRERAQIMDDVLKVVPNARFVALHYVHEPKGLILDGIREVTRQRVLDRGDNHQTIRAGSKSRQEITAIMEGFLDRFQGCDTSHEPDSNFDEVIDLDVSASSLENLETVITRLYNAYPKLFTSDMPTADDMQEAIESSLGQQVTKKHDLSFNKAPRLHKNQNQQNAGQAHQPPPERIPTPQQLVGQLEYFSIAVSPQAITSTLESVFASASAEEKRMYNQLKQTRRIQSEFHVTLIHRANSKDNAKVWQQYTEAYNQVISQVDLSDKGMRAPKLGNTQLKLERVVWDDRVMSIVVRVFPSLDGMTWPSANAIPHITIGTAGQDIKPKESNDLLARWEAGDVRGSKIWEKETGQKVIDGVVKPVFQRGRG